MTIDWNSVLLWSLVGVLLLDWFDDPKTSKDFAVKLFACGPIIWAVAVVVVTATVIKKRFEK